MDSYKIVDMIYIHYKKFLRISLINYESSPNETGNLQALYLTYFGLVRMLITTRNKIAEQFQKWAMKTLFTIQIGNEIEKEELGTKILNINIETYRNVFKTHSTSLPCVYLTELGKVKDLKDTFNIRDYIYKFGFTDDIDRRLSEHQSDYGKLKNVNLQLTKFTIVEQRYKVEAEKDLRQFFETFNKRLIIKINKLLKNQLKIQELEHINKYKDLELKMKDMEIACLRNNIKL